LGWVGVELGWTALGWIGSGWVGLGWIEFGCGQVVVFDFLLFAIDKSGNKKRNVARVVGVGDSVALAS
jgi:hypothetical protein